MPRFIHLNLFLCLPSSSLTTPSYLSQPTCQDGLVNPESGGFDGEDADVCRDFVPHCRERSEFSWEWSFLSSQSLPQTLQALQHPAIHRPSAQESPSIPTPEILSCCPPTECLSSHWLQA